MSASMASASPALGSQPRTWRCCIANGCDNVEEAKEEEVLVLDQEGNGGDCVS